MQHARANVILPRKKTCNIYSISLACHLLHADWGKGQLQTLVQQGGKALESVKHGKKVVGGRGLLEGSSRNAGGAH